eukprot:gene36423-41216_t
MLAGRFLPMIFVLALAGRFATQQHLPPSAGTLPTHRPLFVALLSGVALVVVGLTYVPVLALGPIILEALPGALRKLDPRALLTTPVLLVVEVGAAATTVMAILDPTTLAVLVTVWLWLTVLFGTLAESVAEGRGKAQAASLRALQQESLARRLRPDGSEEEIPSTQLRSGDLVVVVAGERIPGDGDVVEGVASVDESAVTGESAPVIRESGGDRCAVTGGTVVLSDRIVVRITSEPGHSFVDRMIALVEGSERQRTPNEIALNVLLTALTV